MKQFSDSLTLRDDRIIETISTLRSRIQDRFPNAGLTKLCGQLEEVSKQAAQRSSWIERPILWIRMTGFVLATVMLLIIVALVYTAFTNGAAEDQKLSFIDFIQVFESGVNEAIFIGAAIYFLVSIESRIKRRRALEAIHDLRSIAHIIDMHQLTKDPERLGKTWKATKNSPQPTLTRMELNRYLDYCSEMLSLTGKIAALYVRRFDDPVAVDAAGDVEQLTTGLSRKIWQKIMILREAEGSDCPKEATQELPKTDN